MGIYGKVKIVRLIRLPTDNHHCIQAVQEDSHGHSGAGRYRNRTMEIRIYDTHDFSKFA